MQRDRIHPWILAEHLHLPRRRAQDAEQDADRRRLAGAVGSEEPVDLTGLDGQVEVVQGAGRPEGLDQPSGLDGGSHGPILLMRGQ